MCRSSVNGMGLRNRTATVNQNALSNIHIKQLKTMRVSVLIQTVDKE